MPQWDPKGSELSPATSPCPSQPTPARAAPGTQGRDRNTAADTWISSPHSPANTPEHPTQLEHPSPLGRLGGGQTQGTEFFHLQHLAPWQAPRAILSIAVKLSLALLHEFAAFGM